MKTNRQAGFSAVEGLLVVLVLAAVGAVGYVAMHRATNKTANSAVTTNSTTSHTTPVAPELKKTSDLTTAQQALDQSSLDSSDSALDAELNDF